MRALRIILSCSFLMSLAAAALVANVGVAKSASIPIRVCGSLGRQTSTLLANALQEKYTHLTVEFTRIDSANSSTALSEQLTANNCDLYLTPADTAIFVQLMGKELFVPLDAYVMRDRFELGPFGPLVELGRSAGVLYSLPISVTPVVTYYNKNMFTAVGLPAPNPRWTWEEFSDIAIMLDMGRQRRSVMLHPGIWSHMVSEAGGDTLTAPTVIFEKTLTWLAQMLSDATIALVSGERNFYENRSPMIVASMSAMPPQGWVGIAPLPAIAQGLQSAPVSAMTLSLSKASQHPHEAWLVARFLAGTEGATIQARLRNIPAYRSPSVVATLDNSIDHKEALNVIETMQMAVPRSHSASQEASFRAYINTQCKALADGKLLPHEVLQLVVSQQATLQEEAHKASAH